MSIFDDYEQELLTKANATKDAEREAENRLWVKQRQADIAAGLYNAEGEYLGPEIEEDEEEEDEEDEDEDSDSEEESDL